MVKLVWFIKLMSEKHFNFIRNYSETYNEFIDNLERYKECNDIASVSSNSYLVCEDRIIRYSRSLDPDYPITAILSCISDNWFEP